MKKLVAMALCMALAISVCAFSAQAAGLVNPMTEYASLEEINELLGCYLQHPAVMGVVDEGYRTITTGGLFDIGEYCFWVNGMHYCYRFCADYDEDISGVWLGGVPAFHGRAGDAEYASGEGKKLARWANTDGQYTICVMDEGALAQEQFEGIVSEMMSASMASETSAMLPDGMYLDAYSQRAVANVAANADGSYHITVSWANSAFETYLWEMDAAFAEEGLLYYRNCQSSFVTYGENGAESVEILYENGEGFFGVSEHTLYWNGAAEETCRECAFVYAP